MAGDAESGGWDTVVNSHDEETRVVILWSSSDYFLVSGAILVDLLSSKDRFRSPFNVTPIPKESLIIGTKMRSLRFPPSSLNTRQKFCRPVPSFLTFKTTLFVTIISHWFASLYFVVFPTNFRPHPYRYWKREELPTNHQTHPQIHPKTNHSTTMSPCRVFTLGTLHQMPQWLITSLSF